MKGFSMTSATPAMRERYLAESVATASPAKLLLMLFDRLVLDLSRGEQALLDGDRPGARENLLHAQDIVMELQVSLKLDVWEGAKDLARIYAFVTTELINATRGGSAAALTRPFTTTHVARLPRTMLRRFILVSSVRTGTLPTIGLTPAGARLSAPFDRHLVGRGDSGAGDGGVRQCLELFGDLFDQRSPGPPEQFRVRQ